VAKKAYREISLLRQLSEREGSHCITRLIDVISSEEEGSPVVFLILDHGTTDLHSYLKSLPKLAEKDVIAILYHLLFALRFLEEANVLHRDIKPQNILIEPESKQIKICDFGLARSSPHPKN